MNFALAGQFWNNKKGMEKSSLRTKAREFAICVIAICDAVDQRKGREVLVKQLIRSATSIGANIYEANYAASKADFANKLQIALKECFESEYWIDLLGAVNAIEKADKEKLLFDSGIIRRMLVKSINTCKGAI